jgi:hypothetical protein
MIRRVDVKSWIQNSKHLAEETFEELVGNLIRESGREWEGKTDSF